MRRMLLTSILAASLVGSAAGCHHLAGVCDCETQGCAVGSAPVAQGEPPVAAHVPEAAQHGTAPVMIGD